LGGQGPQREGQKKKKLLVLLVLLQVCAVALWLCASRIGQGMGISQQRRDDDLRREPSFCFLAPNNKAKALSLSHCLPVYQYKHKLSS